MGALLGSFYCAGKTPAEIQEIAKAITKNWLRQNMLGDITFPRSGFLAGQTLSGLAEIGMIPVGGSAFRHLPHVAVKAL